MERTAAAMGGQAQGPVQGYMSPKTKVYLVCVPLRSISVNPQTNSLIQSDVSDHLETALSSLDQFATMTDNLIDFVFNVRLRRALGVKLLMQSPDERQCH
jgi:hypothetical protein